MFNNDIYLCCVCFAEILCYDKDPVTFNYDDVTFQKRRMFFVFYAMPISFMFFIIMFLTIYSIYHLQIMVEKGVNKAMIRLLRRLIPLSSVFFIAFTPTAVFFLRGYVTNHENFTNKTIAIVGQVLSGTLYAVCYAYFCYVDYTYVSSATKRILDIELANESNLDRHSTVDSICDDRMSAIDDFPVSTIGVIKKNTTAKNGMPSETAVDTLASPTQNPLSIQL
jgi:hypothetical protein